MKIEVYFENDLVTVIDADYKKESVRITNYDDDIFRNAFGVVTRPTWQQYLDFLESRCVPRTRDKIKWYLQEIGVDCYEPLEIIKKTEGRLLNDFYTDRKGNAEAVDDEVYGVIPKNHPCGRKGIPSTRNKSCRKRSRVLPGRVLETGSGTSSGHLWCRCPQSGRNGAHQKDALLDILTRSAGFESYKRCWV